MNGTRLDGSSNSSATGQANAAGDVLALIGEVERHLDRIRQAQEAGAAKAAAAEERFRELEQRESDVVRQADSIEAARTLILGRERELATERETLVVLRDELASRETTLRDRALALRGEAERVERESTAARELAAEADRRCTALVAERDSLSGERDLARAAVERLRHEANLSQERSVQLESRLAELESRGRALDAALVAKDAELAMSRQALDAAVAKLTTLAAAVATYAPQVERVAAACPPGASVPAVDLEPMRSRIAELESLLAAVRAERNGLEAELAPLRDRVAGLESELAQALAAPVSTVAAAAESADSAVQREFALRLEEKSRRIAELAGFLRTRKQRLDRLHAMLRSLPARRMAAAPTAAVAAPVGASAARIAEENRLADLRERLQVAADRLAETEERMVHRYAHARAPIVAAWIVIAVATLATLSWAAAGTFFARMSVASCDLVAALPAGSSIEASKIAPWDTRTRSLVTDPATLESVRARLAERGLADLELKSWMDTLRMDSAGPGTLRLTATSEGDARAIAALDTLATTVASASRQAAGTVEGLPKVEIAGASLQPGQVTFSTARPVPDTAARLGRAAAIFSGLVLAGFAIGFVLHRSIVRSRRLVDDESIVA